MTFVIFEYIQLIYLIILSLNLSLMYWNIRDPWGGRAIFVRNVNMVKPTTQIKNPLIGQIAVKSS